MKASLQRRLVLTLLGFTLFAWLASAAVTYIYVNRVLQQQVDSQLSQYASLVAYITGVFARQLEEGAPLYESWSGHDYDQAYLEPIVIDGLGPDGFTPAVNVWEDDHLIAVLEGSPRFGQPVEPGIVDVQMPDGSGHWRILSLYSEEDAVWIRVGIERGAARRDMLQTLGRSLLPLLIVLPLTVAVLYLGVTRGLQPLHDLAGQISQRKPGLLDPVDTANVPSEVAGVVDALNDLLGRLAQALESEQRFTANAAHELLTPLAAIKAEVQLCERQLRGVAGAEVLARIASRVDRASHSVEQLLTLARLDPDLPQVREPVDLRLLLETALADSGHLAVQRNLEVELSAGPACKVPGSQEAIAILLRNLVNNAFRYATPGSVVRLVLAEGDGQAQLVIDNDCEPLSGAEFARLGQRFYRVPGSDGVGSGLGLSIVARIAELHAAGIETGPGERGRGFRVTLRFAQQA